LVPVGKDNLSRTVDQLSGIELVCASLVGRLNQAGDAGDP
jgi:hypothetical protein